MLTQQAMEQGHSGLLPWGKLRNKRSSIQPLLSLMNESMPIAIAPKLKRLYLLLLF